MTTLLTALHEGVILRWLVLLAVIAVIASFSRGNVLRAVGFVVVWWVLYFYVLLGDVTMPPPPSP